jgi:hypothetical protein
MQHCADHDAFQLPNKLTRVTYLLDAIQCNDAPLQAAIALVRNDTEPGGKMNDFEATASYLLPHDPVSKKRTAGTKRGVAEISDTLEPKPLLPRQANLQVVKQASNFDSMAGLSTVSQLILKRMSLIPPKSECEEG